MLPPRSLGYLAGPITIAEAGQQHDLRDHIWDGPQIDDPIQFLHHEAKFILLVEKSNIFERLLQDRFTHKNACILACGNGYPGRSFHRILRQLSDDLRLPFYVLADNDGPGYLFYFLIARGTAARHSRPKKEIAIREAAYIGLRAGDAARLGLGKDVQIDLSPAGIDQLRQLQESPWLKSKSHWQEEIDQLLHRGTTLEMEAVSTLSRSYLADNYLPERLANREFLSL
jgi:DNA topoisomerase VI subunit A